MPRKGLSGALRAMFDSKRRRVRHRIQTRRESPRTTAGFRRMAQRHNRRVDARNAARRARGEWF